MSANAERMTDAIRALLQWLASNSRKIGWQKVSFVLFAIVYPLLLTVYQDELKRVFHRTPTPNHRAVAREVAAAVVERVPANALRNVRYVRQPTLTVRAASRRNSSKVGELHFGDVVVVVRSTKDWTLVELDIGDAQIRGWVFTRGLRRFNVHRRSG
jgi:hypothetical protein